MTTPTYAHAQKHFCKEQLHPRNAAMGFAVNNVIGDVDEDLLCSKCRQVLEDPVKTVCGHYCCNQCLEPVVSDKRTRNLCSKCNHVLRKAQENADEELITRLNSLSLHCTLGCKAVLSLYDMKKHVKSQCELRIIACVNKGCTHHYRVQELDAHLELCEYRLVQCEVCGTCVCNRDMAAHQAVKKCFEKQLKSKRVASARKLSSELKEHRIEMQQQRHMTDQAERQLIKEHYDKQRMEYFVQRRRTLSAGPVMIQSIQARVGSALIVPRYSRTLSQTTPLSCMTCENKFLSGRRPSARRHSHAKVIN